MHILLTGEIQVGKTTIIRNFISQAGLSADGLMTYWNKEKGKDRSLYMAPYSIEYCLAERHLIMHGEDCRLLSLETMSQIFDGFGTEILSKSGRCDVIVMDELGKFESKALAFQKAVTQHINGDIPILGVIQPVRTEFLDKIRLHHKVEVREVTVKNRGEILEWLLQRKWR